ncbi:hypothetical protein ABT336_02250, partial [Micromonospora sp. NPDC000207]
MTTVSGSTNRRRAVVHRIRPTDAARMRALRLEMLADSPLAFLETVAEAAARPHADYAARVAYCSTGPEVAQFVADPAPTTYALDAGTSTPSNPTAGRSADPAANPTA